MNKQRRLAFGSVFVRTDGRVSVKALGLLSALAAVAGVAVLAFAGAGSAAGKNICITPGTAASCLVERAAPHFVSTTNAGNFATAPFSITKFINESGNGGSTATHVVLTAGFNPAVTINSTSITLAINGVAADSSVCTTTPAAPATVVTAVNCPVGNITGGGTAKMTVRFTTAATVALTGTVTYGESKPPGTGQPTNSQQSNSDTLTVLDNATDPSTSGGCFGLSGKGTQTIIGSTAAQTTQATVGQGSGDLPCTYADVGVESNSQADPGAKLKSDISFFEFPTFANNGLATVKMFLTTLPTGVKLNQAVIKEDTNYAVPFFKTYITVPACNKDGSIPAPVGVPAKGSTDATSHSNDLCIFNRSPQPGGGAEFDLHSFGSPPDGHVAV